MVLILYFCKHIINFSQNQIMKKILLPLLLFPLVAFAQSNLPLAGTPSVMQHQIVHFDNDIKSPVQYPQPGQTINPGHTTRNPDAASYPYNPTKVGITTYDLQSNAGLAKRVALYSGGNVSAVYIRSDPPVDPNYTKRYSGYSSYNGTSWTVDANQIEFDRSGWPNIGAVTVGGNTSEMLTSHYAAAGGTTYAGGIYWYENTAVGSTSFQKVVDLSPNRAATAGLLWPRMATSADKVFLIGTFQDYHSQKGVRNPVVYYCYNLTTKKWIADKITLPGYDSTRYGSGSADDYSMDARGQYVAILIGGGANDVALWKSSDSGHNFVKTIVDSFKYAPYDSRVDAVFDTVMTNDGTGTVTLGTDGTAHVTWSPQRAVNATSGDSTFNIFEGNEGIMYWNDKDKQKIQVGYALDYDHNGTIDLGAGNFQTGAGNSGYSGHNLCSMSNTAVDAQGHVFVVYSCPHEQDIDQQSNSSACFRHVYCSVYDGSAWHKPQDVLEKYGWGLENVYATVARDADTKLHIVMMQDDASGIYYPGSTAAQNPQTTDTMIYVGVSTTDLLTDKVGLTNLGVNKENDLFTVSKVYPNPANSNLNIMLNLKQASAVSVKLFNVLGSEMESQNYTTVPFGNSRLELNVNQLPAGVYMCNIIAGGYTTTQRIVIER